MCNLDIKSSTCLSQNPHSCMICGGGSERGSEETSGREGHKDIRWEAIHSGYAYTPQAFAVFKSLVSNPVFTQIFASRLIINV